MTPCRVTTEGHTWHSIAIIHMAAELRHAQRTRAKTNAGVLRARRAGLGAGLMALGYCVGGSTTPGGVPQFWCPSCHAAAMSLSDDKTRDNLSFSVVNIMG